MIFFHYTGNLASEKFRDGGYSTFHLVAHPYLVAQYRINIMKRLPCGQLDERDYKRVCFNCKCDGIDCDYC